MSYALIMTKPPIAAQAKPIIACVRFSGFFPCAPDSLIAANTTQAATQIPQNQLKFSLMCSCFLDSFSIGTTATTTKTFRKATFCQ